jgi:hypothetical protein
MKQTDAQILQKRSQGISLPEELERTYFNKPVKWIHRQELNHVNHGKANEFTLTVRVRRLH